MENVSQFAGICKILMRRAKCYRRFAEISLMTLAFGACERSDEKGVASRGMERDGVKNQSSLTVYTWEDYIDPEVLRRFEEETEVMVEYVTFEGSDELEAKLRSEPGRHDVVIVDDTTLSKLIELKLLQKIDHSKLPLLSNTSSEFLDQKYDPKNEFSTPFLWGSWVVAYRKDKFPEVNKSWAFLWDEQVKERVLMINDT